VKQEVRSVPLSSPYLDPVRGRTDRWSHGREYAPATKTQA
jgi:hypothetical protein